MFGKEVDEALKELEEFEKSLAQIQPKNDRKATPIEKARAQAAQIAEVAVHGRRPRFVV